MWETSDAGELRLVAGTSERANSRASAAELNTVLRGWKGEERSKLWLASRLDAGHWCLAPVRSEPPAPPPGGIERRGAERVTLELAGACLGLFDSQARDTSEPSLDRHESHARAALLSEQVPSVLWITDASLRVTSASGAGLALLGLVEDRIIGQPVAESIGARAQSGDPLSAHQRALKGESVSYPMRWGERRYDAVVEPLRNEKAAIIGVSGFAMDVSDREAALDDAKASRRGLAELKAMVESATDAIIGETLDGVITSWNPGAERLYGYTAEEAIGQNVALVIPPDRPDELPDILERVKLGEHESYETVRVRKDGSRIHVSVTVSPILDADERLVGSSTIARDITERKKVEEQLLHGAMHDSLTDLPNRAFFIERVALAVERMKREPGYRFAVLFLDFDKFKVVNDSLGHAVGDQLLTRIASRLQTCVRPGDVVARLGGDEFTMLLEDVASHADVEKATRRVERAFVSPFLLGDRELYVTCSIGVALSTEGVERPEDLLRDADIAMYRAKSQGRARFELFNPAMRERATARFDMEADLRVAIDRGQLQILFQPIVELKTGRVHAFEALMRWEHPDRGAIQPSEFIPLAEETGLIIPIGRWILREACWHASHWKHVLKDADCGVSVNVSAKQLNHPQLVDDVRDALREEGLDPSLMHLEITESTLMENADASAAVLQRLRDIGVALYVDDFGTGYSSLSYLPRFPIQAIKMDRSFTQHMGIRRTDQELVRSIVDLGTNLGMSVIAEGVENVMQAERLISFGCELAQGFHFAPPLEPAAATQFLEDAGRAVRESVRATVGAEAG